MSVEVAAYRSRTDGAGRIYVTVIGSANLGVDQTTGQPTVSLSFDCDEHYTVDAEAFHRFACALWALARPYQKVQP